MSAEIYEIFGSFWGFQSGFDNLRKGAEKSSLFLEQQIASYFDSLLLLIVRLKSVRISLTNDSDFLLQGLFLNFRCYGHL